MGINETSGMELRGLGNGPAIRGLLDVQENEDHDVLFLSETETNKKGLE